jgi:hypothetical protein
LADPQGSDKRDPASPPHGKNHSRHQLVAQLTQPHLHLPRSPAPTSIFGANPVTVLKLRNTEMASASNPQPTPGGTLFKLPPELRLRIYDLMFPSGNLDLFAWRDHLLTLPGQGLRTDDYVAVLATCHAIYDEAKPVLYTNTFFRIYCSWGKIFTPSRAQRSLGPRYAHLLSL